MTALLSALAPAAASASPTSTATDAAAPIAIGAEAGAEATVAADQVRWVFDYTGDTQQFVVPAGVHELTMLVTGGAGADPNAHVGRGGAGGLTLTRHTVVPGDVLTIWVGQGGVGGGGWGWGCGGDHGHAPDSIGRDGGGGGGASAVTKGAFTDGSGCVNRPGNGSVYAVGGGGGGGGGAGYELIPRATLVPLYGGVGGDAGNPAHRGGDSEFDQSPPAIGGCGGCESGRNGADGGNAVLVLGAGGGGGGGGYVGGGPGQGTTEAGAGGGGGASYAASDAKYSFFQTGDAAGNGQVVLSLEPEIGFGGCHGAPLQHPTSAAHPLIGFHLEGAQGGHPRDVQGGVGGYGGTVDGTVLVPPGTSQIDMYIGCFGQANEHGGWGWTEGGAHGVANTPDAYTGGTGGGSSALVVGSVVAIAGAGGGGGGDADGSPRGGNGGNGGTPAGDGHDGGGDDSSGGDGGSGGCETSGHGGDGGDAESAISGNGGGGGGGGGANGGCGGASGNGEPLFVGAGGGGGGGTSSVAPQVRNPQFGTSARAGDGLALITFGTIAISSAGGSKQRAELNNAFAEPLKAKVTDAAGNPVPGVEVEFDLRGDGPGTPSGVFGRWANQNQTERVTTGADGIAQSSVVSAGINPGSWTAKATLTGYEINDSAHFQLTNDGVPTETLATVDPRPALALAPIAFEAKVVTGVGTAHRTVDFWIDGTKRYTETLVDGTATATYTPSSDLGGFILEPGEHTLVVAYHGDEAHAPSSATATFRVVDAQSVTTITSSMNPAPQFSDIVYEVTTTVPAGYEPLTGYDVLITIGGDRVVIEGTLDENGRFRTDPIGMTQSLDVVATVSGDGPVAGSRDSLVQYIGDDHVGVDVSSSVNPAAAEQPVEFTAVLTPPAGGATPTGVVTFTDGSTVLCETVAVDAVAACTGTGPSSIGAHRIVATYGGDANYAESYGHVWQQTVPGVTVTTVRSMPGATSVFGQPVTFTARVALATGDTADGEVTGTVAFTLDGQPYGDPVPVDADGTAASAPIASLSLGTHEMTADYSGSTTLLPSSGSLDHEVTPAQTTLDLAASAEPSAAGQPVSFTATVAPVAPGSGTPAGTVQFRLDGADFGDAVTLDAGTAVSLSTDSLALGDHEVTAAYTPALDAFTGSEATITHTVVAPSNLVLHSSSNPSEYGDAVTFTAALTPSADDGTVSFTIDGATASGCHAVDLSNGVVQCVVPVIGAGTHAIEATYSGSSTLAPSAAQLGQVVEQAVTATEVSSSANPSLPGQAVRFTATVSTDAGQPVTGTVQFVLDGAALGAPVAVVDGVAVSTEVTALVVDGSHDVTADFSGDANFIGSQGDLTQWVGDESTAITVTSGDNPSLYGETVQFTATVSGHGTTAPTGSVQFRVDGQPFGDPVPVVDGIATSAGLDDLTAGEHTVIAEFVGDGTFHDSSGASTQVVAPARTAVELQSSADPSVFGEPVTFAATVTALAPSTGVPTGAAQFTVDGVPFGDPVDLIDGAAASAPVGGLAVGQHVVGAIFLGDANHAGSSRMLLQDVIASHTSTTVTSSDDPALAGEPVQFTATIGPVAPGAGSPSGFVQFRVDGEAFGAPVAVVDGTAASDPTDALSPGEHTITADYLGDANFAASTGTLTQSLLAVTTTTLSSSLNPSVFGESVEFSATVAAVAPGTGAPWGAPAGAPEGTVQFIIDGMTLGDPVALVDGVAVSPSTADLAAGDHAVEARYSGSSGFGASVDELTQSVGAAATTTAVVSSADPALAGEPVRFEATVSPVAPGAGVATGVVQFAIDGDAFGAPVAIIDGVATADATSALLPGEHTVTADYLGDTNFAVSTGTLILRVLAVTTTTLSSSLNPSAFGESVTFTATVTDAAASAASAGAAAPDASAARAAVSATTFPSTGRVQFSVNGTPLGDPVDLVGGIATSPSTTHLAVGEHTIVAEFTGAGYAASHGELTQQITAITPPPTPPGPPAPPHGSGSGNGSLSNTGSDIAPLIGIAAVLLLLGGAAFVLERRRRRRAATERDDG